MNRKLTYGANRSGLVAYTNSDWASQEHCHSISGHMTLIDGGAVDWCSSKQPIVALSTAEAEYVAATGATKASMWMRQFLASIALPLKNPSMILCDNQSAIQLTKDSKFHARTKHIDVHYHFICEEVEKKVIKVDYVPTAENVADILTKLLNGPRTRKLSEMMGLLST